MENFGLPIAIWALPEFAASKIEFTFAENKTPRQPTILLSQLVQFTTFSA